MNNCRIVDFKNFNDSRGNLVAIEYPKNLDFEIKRIYYIYGVETGTERGFHSHKRLEQVLIAVNGTIKIRVNTPFKEQIYELNDPSKGLYIGPMIWREMFDFSEGAVLLVLASHEYDESDYIRDKEDFIKMGSTYWKEINLRSNNLILQLVEENDANFILKLRTDANLMKYLSKTDNSLVKQKEWIKDYKKREKLREEFYFKAISIEGEDLGLVRLYNIDLKTRELTFGSFIMKNEHPKYAAIETIILVMNYAFDNLKMKKVLLDVRVQNKKAKAFYQRFGFKKIFENDLDEFYELSKKEYEKLYKLNYGKFLPREL